MRTLSSPDTVSAKLIFLPLWTAGWGAGMFILLAGALRPAPEGYVSPPLGVVLIGLVTMTALTAFAWWGFAPLKEVKMDERVLEVSNFWRRETIPLADVVAVTQASWNDLVTVTLRGPSPFGRFIRFMPSKRFVTVFEPHPVVGEILAAAQVARERASIVTEPPSRPDHQGSRRGSRNPQVEVLALSAA